MRARGRRWNISWGAEKTPGVLRMTGKGGNHVLCTTVYMEFSICGGAGGLIFNMFSATHQNTSKAFLSDFRHFYFFPL